MEKAINLRGEQMPNTSIRKGNWEFGVKGYKYDRK